jgi:hypothetical protein
MPDERVILSVNIEDGSSKTTPKSEAQDQLADLKARIRHQQQRIANIQQAIQGGRRGGIPIGGGGFGGFASPPPPRFGAGGAGGQAGGGGVGGVPPIGGGGGGIRGPGVIVPPPPPGGRGLPIAPAGGIPSAAINAGLALGVLTASVTTFKALMDRTNQAFQNLISNTEGLVGSIESAKARAERDLLLARIGIGQSASRAIERNINARTDLQIAFERAEGKFFELFEPFLTAFYRLAQGIMTALGSMLDFIAFLKAIDWDHIIKTFIDILLPPGFAEATVLLVQAIKKYLASFDEKRPNFEDELDAFFDPNNFVFKP